MTDKTPLIIGINGSPRKNGNTVKLLKRVLEIVEKHGGKTKLIHLIELRIKPCAGCYSVNSKLCDWPCKVKGDDFAALAKEVINADGLVLASPVYWFNMSGLMKNFIDRITSLGNVTPLLNGKVVGFAAAGVVDGAAQVISLMQAPFARMGALFPPNCYVFAHRGEVWREEFGDAEEKLGKNLVEFTRLAKRAKSIEF